MATILISIYCQENVVQYQYENVLFDQYHYVR